MSGSHGSECLQTYDGAQALKENDLTIKAERKAHILVVEMAEAK